MRFGVGVSRYDLYREFAGPEKVDFLAKIRAVDEVGIDDVAILFGDTRSDVPDVVAREAEIVHALGQ